MKIDCSQSRPKNRSQVDGLRSVENLKKYLDELYQQWKMQARDDQEICALYLLGMSYFYEGVSFLQSTKQVAKALVIPADLGQLIALSRADLFHLLTTRRIKKIPAASQEILTLTDREFKVLDSIPSPETMLYQQARGVRPVTVIFESTRALKPILNKRNGLHFCLHDLEHLVKFKSELSLFEEQKHFFYLMTKIHPLMRELFHKKHLEKKFEYEYLISDMNTHWGHSLSYFKAFLVQEKSEYAKQVITHLAESWGQNASESQGIFRFFSDIQSDVGILSFLFADRERFSRHSENSL